MNNFRLASVASPEALRITAYAMARAERRNANQRRNPRIFAKVPGTGPVRSVQDPFPLLQPPDRAKAFIANGPKQRVHTREAAETRS